VGVWLELVDVQEEAPADEVNPGAQREQMALKVAVQAAVT